MKTRQKNQQMKEIADKIGGPDAGKSPFVRLVCRETHRGWLKSTMRRCIRAFVARSDQQRRNAPMTLRSFPAQSLPRFILVPSPDTPVVTTRPYRTWVANIYCMCYAPAAATATSHCGGGRSGDPGQRYHHSCLPAGRSGRSSPLSLTFIKTSVNCGRDSTMYVVPSGT